MAEAHKEGYRSFAPEWSNLGQGQPEIGDIPNAPTTSQSDRGSRRCLRICPCSRSKTPAAGGREITTIVPIAED